MAVSSEDEPAACPRDGYRLICAGMDLKWIADGWRRLRETAREAMADG